MNFRILKKNTNMMFNGMESGNAGWKLSSSGMQTMSSGRFF